MIFDAVIQSASPSFERATNIARSQDSQGMSAGNKGKLLYFTAIIKS